MLNVAVLLAATTAHADNAARASALLFPETRMWRQISDAPSVPIPRLVELRSELEASYRAAILAKGNLESGDCSFIARILKFDDASAFRSIDVDEDGAQDIVYAGSAQCAEGDATVVWFAAGQKYEVRQPVIWPFLALRLSPGAKGIASVAKGCCGGPVDRYAQGTLRNFRQHDEVVLFEETVLPANALSAPKPYSAAVELKLRTAPKVQDRYDHDRSESFGHAVLGNTVRKYMSGAKGHVLAELPAKPRGQWLFLLMDKSSDRLVTYDLSGARAGWALVK
jgi:hypothetical protein